MAHAIDREFIRRGGLIEALAEAGRQGLITLTTEEERAASLRETLAGRVRPGRDVWVFAYGSLMWNPAFHYVERRPATVHGYHRRFCLSTMVGRGSPRRPGLVLGLEAGGACRGIAYRIAGAQADEELAILWRREMIALSYRPTWVRARFAAGARDAIAFVMDTTRPQYVGRLPQGEIARRIAKASGALGRCADYLEETVAHLEEHGIHDRALAAIRRRVRALRGGTVPKS